MVVIGAVIVMVGDHHDASLWRHDVVVASATLVLLRETFPSRAGGCFPTPRPQARRPPAECPPGSPESKGAGITQQELAKRLKKPQSFVSKYENGERRLDVVEFLEVATALGFDGHALLRGPRKR